VLDLIVKQKNRNSLLINKKICIFAVILFQLSMNRFLCGGCKLEDNDESLNVKKQLTDAKSFSFRT